MTQRACRKCGAPLTIGENTTQNRMDHGEYICRTCKRVNDRGRWREWSHRVGLRKSMSENRGCTAFLGVHVAERVLSHVFKDVQIMPYGNPGFDFTCRHDKLIDVKGSCRNHSEKGADRWHFTIKQNHIADYFLCLAFNNRNDLNPEHIWLIPGDMINDCVSVSISETMLAKWAQYEQPLNKVISCCDSFKAIERLEELELGYETQ